MYTYARVICIHFADVLCILLRRNRFVGMIGLVDRKSKIARKPLMEILLSASLFRVLHLFLGGTGICSRSRHIPRVRRLSFSVSPRASPSSHCVAGDCKARYNFEKYYHPFDLTRVVNAVQKVSWILCFVP